MLTLVKKLLFFVFLFLGFTLFAQRNTEVILIGTYHMAGTSDKIKVDTNQDNILSDERQKQLNELLNVLSEYKAEKIYVENEPERQFYWDSIYKAYNDNNIISLKNEIFQIGIRLASKLNLKNGVLCVDWHLASSKFESDRLYALYCEHIHKLSDSIGVIPEYSIYDKLVMDDIIAFNHEIPKMHLISVFEKLNSEAYLKKLFYGNITTYLDENAEGMGTFWAQYQMMRNYNIYSNIIKDILKDKPNKVLILYGAGHIEALRMMLANHPGIMVTDFNTLIAKYEKSKKHL